MKVFMLEWCVGSDGQKQHKVFQTKEKAIEFCNRLFQAVKLLGFSEYSLSNNCVEVDVE